MNEPPSTVPPRQLALQLLLPESHAREDFLVTESNATAFAAIDGWPDWPAPVLALVGPPGAGKSHLGAIWADASGARRIRARDLAGCDLRMALATGALLIADVDAQVAQTPLFHLLNLAREEGANLLMTAATRPSSWPIALPDLASRLRAVPVVEIGEPDDALLRAVMVKLFADRQMIVDAGVVEYVARRIERSLATVRAAVDTLDRMSLESGRRVTRPLAAQFFGGSGEGD